MASGTWLTGSILLGAANVWVQPALACLAGGAVCLAVLAAVNQVFRAALPKLAAVTWTTAKEALAQPLFGVLMFIGVCGLLLFPFIPYNTFGEDIKVLKDSGLALILVLGIILALWTASVSIADEIEGRTALTLLSKPITRRQFILGKFLGINAAVLVLSIVLGALFLASVAYKVAYDARENADPSQATVARCAGEVVQVLPGLVLAFLETVVLSSISVAISTRLPMLSNLIMCSAIYALGHLVPALVNSVAGQFEIVAFVGRLISIVLPVLDYFNIQSAVATGANVPLAYLGWAGLYCLVYSAAALCVALVLFEDRDLA